MYTRVDLDAPEPPPKPKPLTGGSAAPRRRGTTSSEYEALRTTIMGGSKISARTKLTNDHPTRQWRDQYQQA